MARHEHMERHHQGWREAVLRSRRWTRPAMVLLAGTQVSPANAATFKLYGSWTPPEYTLTGLVIFSRSCIY
jgi:hypothetical protein